MRSGRWHGRLWWVQKNGPLRLPSALVESTNVVECGISIEVNDYLRLYCKGVLINHRAVQALKDASCLTLQERGALERKCTHQNK